MISKSYTINNNFGHLLLGLIVKYAYVRRPGEWVLYLLITQRVYLHIKYASLVIIRCRRALGPSSASFALLQKAAQTLAQLHCSHTLHSTSSTDQSARLTHTQTSHSNSI